MRRPLGILHGAHEAVARLDYIRTLALPTLWRGRVHVIEEAGHTPQWETPTEFDRYLFDFASDCFTGF